MDHNRCLVTYHMIYIIFLWDSIIKGCKPKSPHIIESILDVPCFMIHIIWSISYGPYDINHMICSISYDIGVKHFHPFFDVDQNVHKQVMSNAEL